MRVILSYPTDTMARMLLRGDAFTRARTFLFEQARPLDRERFRFLFEGGSAAGVLRELAAFQNDDGGFGHALEPDLRCAASSAIATWHGFAVLREIGAAADEPMARRAVDYLLATLDRERWVWPIVPAAVEDAPHAPWWTHAGIDEAFDGSRINPTASLLGVLHEHAEQVPAALLAELTERVLARVESAPDALPMNDLPCLLALAAARHLPEPARARVEAKALRAAPLLVASDPADWTAYVLQPLDVVRAPGSFLAAVVDEAAVQANLDYWISRQSPTGSWPLTWDWSFVDERAWARAKLDNEGCVTVDRLHTLSAWGRVDAGLGD
ncbi:hypothetical protein F4553_006636 [Allocatelliglobosispora scoriae]|uniref:Prenyltransferase n=1 Tax=Allocatelliglobosispora scoriae TaxID=643052 RepID=A0A841C2C5_9ACTN|nr:hypothetical protein [Allocatelliglobosispora scoriae]MBB5873202.1 hypothetical protein [Allocatelliglobosispora scoriae]